MKSTQAVQDLIRNPKGRSVPVQQGPRWQRAAINRLELSMPMAMLLSVALTIVAGTWAAASVVIGWDSRLTALEKDALRRLEFENVALRLAIANPNLKVPDPHYPGRYLSTTPPPAHQEYGGYDDSSTWDGIIRRDRTSKGILGSGIFGE